MNILLLGARGQLGVDLVAALSPEHDVTAWDVDELDITDLNAVMGAVRKIRPALILNAAAYTDVDGCESNTEIAYRVNALGPRNLAIAALEEGSRILHISTDFVFDGEKRTPYLEFDEPNPVSVYGRSKLAGEQAIREITPRHYILRTAWLYGKHGHNFVKTMLRLAGERDTISVVDDQVGTPTTTADLIEAILAVIGTDAYGTYHATCEGACSWYDFAVAIFRHAGVSVRVEPTNTEALGRPAKRPAYSVLDNFMLRCQHHVTLRDWESALCEFMKNS
jgi:dTDP-4-dehydrorhamnose reductase